MSENETELVATEVLATEVLATELVATEVVGTVRLETPTEVVATQPSAEEPVATQAFAEEAAATQAFAEEAVPGTLLLTEPADVSEVEAPAPAATPAPAPILAPAPSGLRRVGPGVPVPGAGASEIAPAIAAAWHGVPPEKPRRFPHRGWLLPLAVLIGVIILLLWQRAGGRLAVSGVSTSAAASSIGCDSTEVVTATLHTNGHAGTVVYRWERSDGTVSDEIRQPVGDGTKQVDVVLRWAFAGHGSMNALATIQVASPGTASSSASFVYSCP